MRLLIIIGVHLVAALLPFIGPGDAQPVMEPAFDGWPSEYQGRPLIPLEAQPVAARFAGRFPGRLARFTDGRREFVFRHVERPSRALHAAADCYKGSGYDVEPKPVRRGANGELMGCVLATRDGQSVRVCERVFDAAGASWYDVSSWYWAALLKQSAGPWWAVTVAEPM